MKRFAAATLISLGACVSNPAPNQPATLGEMDDANTAALKAALANAMGRANIKLGPTGEPPVTHVTVLPPPRGEYEMNSPVLPTHFNIITDGTDCWLEKQDTGEIFPAPDVTCAPSSVGE